MFKLLSVAGNPNVGVVARATDTHAFVPSNVTAKEFKEFEEAFEVPVHRLTLGGSSLIGSLVAANTRGILLADFATKVELKQWRAVGIPVHVLEDRLNAAGNNLLVNDHGALCNPDYSDRMVEELATFLGVPVQRGTLAGLGTVGMAGVATNHGVLVHPKATPEEREAARRALGRDVMVGTINQGTALIGAGLVANSKGAVMGSQSTGIEIGRVEDALGFLPAR